MAYRTLSNEEIDTVLEGLRVMRVGFFSPTDRYVIALGYTWHQSMFWGSTMHGRKTEIAEADNRVAFIVDNSIPFTSASVAGEGLFEKVSLRAALEVVPMMKQRFPDNPDWNIRDFQAGLQNGSATFWRIVPTHLSGRQFVPS